MKYTAYPTFIDYLFSSESKESSYGDLRAYLVSSGSFSDFAPTDGLSISLEGIRDKLVPPDTFDTPSCRTDCRSRVSDSVGLYSETDKTYEEVLNIPASSKIEQSSYASVFAVKAARDAALSSSAAPSDLEQSVREYAPMSDSFVEEEYDSWRIPLTFLNGDVAGLVAEDLVFSGSELSVSRGCLLGVQKDDRVYPMGFIDFEELSPCTRYGIKFDPQGILQLT